MHRFHIVYKITNKVNNKFYLGIHSTNDINDSYMGSGAAIKAAVLKYGKENFMKEIIGSYSSRDEALAEEKRLVTEQLVKSDDCYNLKTGGSSGFIYSENWIKQVSDRAKKNHTKTINSEAAKIKRAAANRRRAESGEYSTPERRKKLSEAGLKQSKVISERVKNNWSDIDHSEYIKRRMREAKANAPTLTCPCCNLQMKANLKRHIKAQHPHFELA